MTWEGLLVAGWQPSWGVVSLVCSTQSSGWEETPVEQVGLVWAQC